MAYSDYANMTSVGDLVTRVSSDSGGMFGLAVWGLTYIVLWIVITLSATRMGSQEPAKESFLASSAMMVFVTILMSTIDWVPEEVTVVPIVLAVVGVIILVRKNQ